MLVIQELNGNFKFLYKFDDNFIPELWKLLKLKQLKDINLSDNIILSQDMNVSFDAIRNQIDIKPAQLCRHGCVNSTRYAI